MYEMEEKSPKRLFQRRKQAMNRCLGDISEILRQEKLRKRILGVLEAVLIAGLLGIFIFVFRGKHYIAISMLMVFLILASFLWGWERRKPRAREIVMLSVMTALTVVANEICSHSIPLHAGSAMIVICGIAFGPEAGFMTGAMSRLVCNFFDGQGPWTPWQMLCWGMIGFLAGIVFNKVTYKTLTEQKEHPVTLGELFSMKKDTGFKMVMGPVICIFAAWIVAYLVFVLRGGNTGESFWGWRLYLYGFAGLVAGCLLQRKKMKADSVSTTIFTFVVIFLIYGGIMNFVAMLLGYLADPAGQQISMKSLRVLYFTGLPYDLSHAGGAAFCVFLFGESLLQKFERIQLKFGIRY